MKDNNENLEQVEDTAETAQDNLTEETPVEGAEEGTQAEILTPEEMAKALEQQTALAEDYLTRLQRLQADFENFRRRVTKEKEDFAKYASESLICSMLPILDNFERALASGESGNLLTGVEMIFRQFKEVLEKEGLCPINAVDNPFDPNCHEAVMQVETDEHPDNTVIEEFQKGYLLKDKVIRPAMVKVAKN